ncbi:AAA family ATPase [Mycobacterium sp. 852002-51057_SCH5723018]|uniref:AAA family ATPase n=1 Tax=Mycobacterium sp. 852002-51057_SCH5723018 TaxID=1834094 RepID=UPI0009EF2E6C|nr:AAA family ATPase [Mycobacterium sp. 852002-51057_SCH5723018]
MPGAREPAPTAEPVTRSSAPWITITGLDGSGKTTLLQDLVGELGGFQFRLPYHQFVRQFLNVSGAGTAFGDVHTDRLLFAADARLTNCLIGEWRQSHPLLLSQRGWMDNFIFGAVQGVSYEEADELLRPSELERPSAIIYLTAEPQVAFSRIAADRNGDKYETLDFIAEQHRETSRFYESVKAGLQVLAPFAGIPAIFIDTTTKTRETVLREGRAFLARTLAAKPESE